MHPQRNENMVIGTVLTNSWTKLLPNWNLKMAITIFDLFKSWPILNKVYVVDLKSNLALVSNEGHNLTKVFFPQNMSNKAYFPA